MIADRIAEYLLESHEFCKAHEHNLFWRHHIDAQLLGKLFSWNELNRCLAFNRITNDRFRMSTRSEHAVVNRRAFRPVKDSLGRSTDHLVVSELHKLMREGVTAVLEAVNELSPTVCVLTERISGELGARSTANAYISFGCISGFGVHNDDHDVIILQLDGRKEWRFLKSATRDKATVADFRDPIDAKGRESTIVSAGDVLYVPKGTWHEVVALNEKALHLTVSVVYPTIGNFVRWSLDQDKVGVPSDDIKPCAFRDDRVIERCRAYLRDWANRENLESFLRAFYAGNACSRMRANFPSLNVANVSDRFRRVPYEVVTLLSAQANRRDIYALGRLHSLSHEEHDVLCSLPRVGAMLGCDVAKLAGGWETTAVILEALMDRGLITTVVDGDSDRSFA